jgi:hypothetical protein
MRSLTLRGAEDCEGGIVKDYIEQSFNVALGRKIRSSAFLTETQRRLNILWYVFSRKERDRATRQSNITGNL